MFNLKCYIANLFDLKHASEYCLEIQISSKMNILPCSLTGILSNYPERIELSYSEWYTIWKLYLVLSIFILLFSMMHCFFFCNCSAFQRVSLRCAKMSECESVAVSVHSKSAFITHMSIMLSSHRGMPTEDFPVFQLLCKKCIMQNEELAAKR